MRVQTVGAEFGYSFPIGHNAGFKDIVTIHAKCQMSLDSNDSEQEAWNKAWDKATDQVFERMEALKEKLT